MSQRLNLDDWETEARARLEPMVADYYAGGAGTEDTLRGNREAWRRRVLRHRVLVDVSGVDASDEIAGDVVRSPIVVAPTAFHGLAHPDAELATARGAAAAGSAMCLSTLSNTPVEDVVAAAQGVPVLFQLYVYRDREVTKAIVKRTETAGCRALVVTVDAAILGTRERDVRNGFHLPAHLALPNAAPGRSVDAVASGSGLATYVGEQLDPTLTWRDLEWLMQLTTMPVYVKGVVRADDATEAVQMGVAGIIVSNHGGRQLDGGIATAEALPEVIDAAAGRCAVWVDGGLRRGTDVLKALAMGADAVMVGRPALWGLAVDGANGVQGVLDQLRGELEEAMALVGAPRLADVSDDLVR